MQHDFNYEPANSHAAHLAEIAEYDAELADALWACGMGGHQWVNRQWVPNELFDRLTVHLSTGNIGADAICSPRDMVGEGFYATLSKSERKVLGPCLEILIDEGFIRTSLPRSEDKYAKH